MALQLFPALQRIQEPSISGFLSKVPSSFMKAYDKLIVEENVKNGNEEEENFLNRLHINRQMMLEPIMKFHRRAGTFTSGVEDATKLLKDPSTKVLVSTHQPNLFAYGGIFKKIVLLQTLKDHLADSALKIVNLFVVIDHDFAGEHWIRVAQLPNIRSIDGVMQLRLPVVKSSRWQLVCNMPLPSRMVLDHWRHQLYSWIQKSAIFQQRTVKSSDHLESAKLKLISNLDSFWNLVEQSYDNADTYAEFNSHLMSKIVNRAWQYDTLFIKLTDLSKIFERGYGNLLRNFDNYSKNLKGMEQLFLKEGIPSGVSSSSYLYSTLWLHCNCGSKAATKISNRTALQDNKTSLTLAGHCMGCKKYLRSELMIDVDGAMQCSDSYTLNDFSPRSIPIVLLLSSELGISCYASGTDGMRYILFGNTLFKEFSPKNTPVFIVWPARDSYYGFAQSEALRSIQLTNFGDMDGYVGELDQKEKRFQSAITPILNERNQTIRQGKQTARDDILSNLFSLKQEQRTIRSQRKLAEKVENVLTLRPSVIDYAINFGLEQTEMHWRNGVLYNDNLNRPNNISSENNFFI